MQQEQQGSHPTFETAPQVRPAAAQEAAEPGARTSVRDLSTRELGARGELMAANNLAGRGWEILGRNWRCPFGEVDIIASQGDVLAFVEVKARSSEDYGTPSQAVNRQRMERYINAARFYFSGREIDCTVRFDVIEVEGKEVNHIISAFTT